MKTRVIPIALAATLILAGCVPGEQVQPRTTGAVAMTSEIRKFHAAKCGPYTVSMYGVPQISLAQLMQEGTLQPNPISQNFLIKLETDGATNVRLLEYKIVDLAYYGKVEAIRKTPSGQKEVFLNSPSDISGPALTEDEWVKLSYNEYEKAFVLEGWRINSFFSGVDLSPGRYRWREKPIGTVRINGTEECRFPIGVYEFTITP